MWASISRYFVAGGRTPGWMARIARDNRGSVAIETVFIMGALLMLGLVGYEIAAYVKAKERAEYAFYNLGNTVSSARSSVSCDFLDRIAQLAYRGYASGNWGRKDRNKDWEFNENGGEDFRFQIDGLRVQDPADPGVNPNNLRAVIEWSFNRTLNDLNAEKQQSPGNLKTIPKEYQVPGAFLIYVEGRHFVKQQFGFFDIFDRRLGRRFNYDFYFSPRYQPSVALEEPYDGVRCDGI